MDNQALFPDGQSISAFVRGTQQLLEGVVHTRSDGIRVLLREDGKFKKLSDLEKITRTGTLLHEENVQLLDQQLDGIFDDSFNFDEVKKQNKRDVVIDAGTKVIGQSEEAKKSGLKDEELHQKVEDKYAANEMKHSEANQTGGNDVKAENAILDQYKQIQESMSERLSDELGYDDDEDEYDSIGDHEAVDEFFDDIDPEINAEADDIATPEEAFDYEDEEYKSTSEETWAEALEAARDKIELNADELVEYLTDHYELSLEDAEKIALEAIQGYISQTDDYDCSDEVDEEFEAAIDEFEGDEEDVLDHLVDVFEIPESEAERIIVESQGRKGAAILGLAEYVKRSFASQLI
jgi:hypothetical protein